MRRDQGRAGPGAHHRPRAARPPAPSHQRLRARRHGSPTARSWRPSSAPIASTLRFSPSLATTASGSACTSTSPLQQTPPRYPAPPV